MPKSEPHPVGDPTRFPPLVVEDIEAYSIEDCVAGYVGHEAGDPVPGPNHAPGYRWGWFNRARDRSNGKPDEFEAVRSIYAKKKIAATRIVAGSEEGGQ